MKVCMWLLVSVALLGPLAAARACTNVYGVPGECRMRILALGRGAADTPAPIEVASVRMDGNWAYAACVPSPDGAVNVVFPAEDELEVHYQGRRRRLKRDPRQGTSAHSVAWDPSGRRFAFYTPRAADGAPARIGVVDVRALSGDPPFQLAYTARAGHQPVEVAWLAGGDELLVFERRPDGTSGVLRADVTSGRQQDVLPPFNEPIDYMVANHHRPPGALQRILLGGAQALRLLRLDTGELLPLPLPGAGVFNVELSRDGRRAALFYRRPAPGPAGKTFVGVYLVDLDAAAAGRADAIEQLDEAVDVHTLWLSDDDEQVLWASPGRLCVRRVDAAGQPPRVLFQRGDPLFARDDERGLTGAAFDHAGRKVAVTLGPEVYVVDLATGGRAQVAQVRGFAAQPWWSGDLVVVTTYQDASTAERPR